jgi:tartrate dehydrogenase/decarboxylase/D-malate dehydrogenase
VADQITAEMGEEYTDVSCDKMPVNAMTMRMMLKTSYRFVASDLHAGIPWELMSAATGRPSVAPTAQIDSEHGLVSMFGPIERDAATAEGAS